MPYAVTLDQGSIESWTKRGVAEATAWQCLALKDGRCPMNLTIWRANPCPTALRPYRRVESS